MSVVRYVLDTNVISALRRPSKNPQVAAWAANIPVDHLYVATPTIAELGLGIAAKERTDPAQGVVLRQWFQTSVLGAFAERILDFDLQAALVLSAYRVPEHAPYDDALIAAIAQSQNMTVATRNVKHYKYYGAAFIDPFDS